MSKGKTVNETCSSLKIALTLQETSEFLHLLTEIDITLTPEQASGMEGPPTGKIASAIGISAGRICGAWLKKRSIDARGKQVKILTRWLVAVDEPYEMPVYRKPIEKNVRNEKEVLIAGAGPAGYFAALAVIARGQKPVVMERGKDVKSRRRDLAAITKSHIVNPESNYCFGEGGAGTYSDGKLYTRSDKRGDVDQVLQYLVYFGADPDILVNARPHIGTNKLPGIISAIREFIESCGGEVHFDTRVDDILYDDSGITGVAVNGKGIVKSSALVLATGHSSRLIYEMLHRKGILIEAKPLAIGLRAEHPQSLIDSVQYHCTVRSEFLPPAYYSVSAQVDGRGVYSFCMCPGGIIAPCATSPGEVVTNGWSPSKRNNPFANSGIVVEIRLEDIMAATGNDGPLMALDFQHAIEYRACELAGGTQTAPAQRLVDFVNGKVSATLPECSYLPGIASCDLRDVFPEMIHTRLRQGFQQIGKKMPSYYTNEAVLVAPETRTSSPVKIPRDKETLQHIQVAGLFPCAEGAGYAGGIVSAAIDGMKCGEKATDRNL